jgi:tetratricopeptide (TPR) repeat protein
MKDSNMLLEKDNLFSKNVNNLITQYKNDIITKAINLYLSANYHDAEMYLLTEFPENSFNEDSLVQYIMGHIKLKLEEFESALNYFCHSLKNEVNQIPLVYDSRGLTCLLQRDYNGAIRNFKEACTYSQNNFHFHNHLALCYQIILNVQKNKEEKIINLSRSKLSESEMSKESDKLSKSKSISSSNLDSIEHEKEKEKRKVKDKNKLSKITNNNNIIKKKIKEAFQDAININPNSYISLLNLGTHFANEGQIDQAEKYYKRAENINKQTDQNDWKIYINLAYVAFHEKEYQLSMGYFEMTLKFYEDKMNFKALNIYMICLYKNKEWTKLEKVAKKILSIDRKNKKALVYLINCLEKNKKLEELLLLLNKIKSKLKTIKENHISEDDEKSKSEKEIESFFQSPLSQYNKLKQIIRQKLKETNEKLELQRALINEDNNELQLAKLSKDTLKSFGFKNSDIERILILYRKNPNNLEALFNLGYIYYKEEEFEKSEEYLKRIIEINPNYKKNIVYECLGDIYMNEYNLPKRALEYYTQSKVEEDNELLLVKIGICYEILDDNENALKYYKLAHEKNDEFVNPIFHIGCIYDKMNNPEAIKYLEIAYEREKENVDYLQKYGDILVQSEDESKLSKGILILEKGIEFFTGNIEIISSLAKGYEKQGKLKEAIQLLEKAKNNEEFSNNKSKVFQLASYYEKAKELTKAVDFFKKVLVLDKRNVEALLHIGYIYRSIKENVKAFKCFKQILLIEPNNFLAFYGLGRLYQSLDNHDNEAIECYKNCLNINSESLKANLQLGIIYLKIKKYEESLNCLQKVIQIEPNNVLGLVSLGNVYLEMNDYEEAEKNLNLALRLDKKNVAALAALGDVFFSIGKYTEAIPKYIFVNKLNEHIPEVHLNLGHCYFITEKFDLAILNYLQAIKLVKNTRHDYYYFLGNALIANMRIKDGIIAYQAAIKLKPNKLNYYYAIAKACYIEKLYSKGIKYLEKLLDLEKNKKIVENDKDYTNNDVLFLLFRLYYSLPDIDYDKCSNIVKNLVRNDPKNIQYLEVMATLQEKTDHAFDAIKTYKQILRLEPNHSDAKKKINLLYTNTKKKSSEFEKENNKSSSSDYDEEEEKESENENEDNGGK